MWLSASVSTARVELSSGMWLRLQEKRPEETWHCWGWAEAHPGQLPEASVLSNAQGLPDGHCYLPSGEDSCAAKPPWEI